MSTRGACLNIMAAFLLAASWGAVGLAAADQSAGIDFLPPPPKSDSPDFKRDLAIYEAALAEKGGPRWRQAIFDAADLAHLPDLFLEALGVRITPETTPATHALLWMVGDRLPRAVDPIKRKYQRVRPFVYFQRSASTCTPQDELGLSRNGSYPSGHTTRGWGLALVLAEIAPERRQAILARGYELGQSRVVCGVHWQSDVDAGRLFASALVVQLHGEPEFMRLLEEAKKEFRLCGPPPETGALRPEVADPVSRP